MLRVEFMPRLRLRKGNTEWYAEFGTEYAVIFDENTRLAFVRRTELVDRRTQG